MIQIKKLFVIAAGALALAALAWPSGAPGAVRSPYLAFQPDAKCADCHRLIGTQHAASAHAESETGAAFLAGEKMAAEKNHAERLCAPCHRPMTSRMDPKDENYADVSGVGCHFCHSITEAASSISTAGYKLDVGHFVTGPREDVVAPTHRATALPLMKEAVFCRGCHQFENRAGVAIYDDYRRWETSPAAAEGKTCQSCHMTDSAGPPVRQSAIGGPLRDEIRPHSFWGGLDPGFAEPAVSLDYDILLSGTSLSMEARLVDVAGAHAFPAGSPLRAAEIRLEALDESGAVTASASAWVRRTFSAGQSAKPRDEDTLRFWEATAVLEDTRVPPGGVGEFTLGVEFGDQSSRVRVSLVYHRFDPRFAGLLGIDDPPVRTLYSEEFALRDILELEG